MKIRIQFLNLKSNLLQIMGFIVIEGLDGSGKSTQVKLLTDYLKANSYNVEFIHFPTNDSEIFGDLISMFLRGELGALDQVNPYLVALIFAGDRFNLANKINSWLNEGKHVVNDRYVYSNIAYQCAKCKDRAEADKLFNWILRLEYEYFKIPRPNLNIFLEVPFSFTKNRLTENRNGKDRDYLKAKADIHEQDIEFQKRVKEIYLQAVKKDENFVLIKCFDHNNNILKPQEISEMIIEEIKKYKII